MTRQPYLFRVSVLFYREDGGWAAQCLEYDVGAQGDTLDEAQKAFEQVLIGQIVIDTKHGRSPFDGIEPAPKEYFQMFQDAQRLYEKPTFNIPYEEIPPAFMVSASAAEMRISRSS